MTLYKDKEKQKEANRLAKQRQRGMTRKGMTSEGMTGEGTFFKDGVEYVPASYVQGTTGIFQSLPARPRLLTLSDGQVLDRLDQPLPSVQTLSMNFCNESEYNFHPVKSGHI